jgi:hypothetical protein
MWFPSLVQELTTNCTWKKNVNVKLIAIREFYKEHASILYQRAKSLTIDCYSFSNYDWKHYWRKSEVMYFDEVCLWTTPAENISSRQQLFYRMLYFGIIFPELSYFFRTDLSTKSLFKNLPLKFQLAFLPWLSSGRLNCCCSSSAQSFLISVSLRSMTKIFILS